MWSSTRWSRIRTSWRSGIDIGGKSLKKTKILCTKETTGITNPGHKLANYLPQHKQIVENSTKLMRPKLCQAIPQVEKNTLRFTFPQKTQLCTSAQNKTSQKLDKTNSWRKNMSAPHPTTKFFRTQDPPKRTSSSDTCDDIP